MRFATRSSASAARSRQGLVVLLLTVLCQRSGAQSEKRVHLRGYVVEVVSPSEVVIDDYRIGVDRTYHLIFDSPSLAVPIGADVEVEVQPTPTASDVWRVVSLKRQPFESAETVELPAMLAGPPQDGAFFAAGRRVRLQPSTRITFAKTTPPMTTIDEVGADTLMSFTASHRDADGVLLADTVEFRRNESENGEREMIKQLKIELKEPDVERHRPGGVRVYQGGYDEILANADVQAYVSEIGASLVPRYQRDMADSSPTKIPFKFYVVKRGDVGAVAQPNGIVLVYSRLFEVAENEAQLAAVMGHEIAHVTQEHAWQQRRKLGGSVGNTYTRAYENQADRLGLAYMVDAGYDPRQAARVGRVLTMKFGFVLTNAYGGNHDNHALRRAYLMHEIETSYRDLDYSALKTAPARFKRIADLVKGEVDPTWKARQDKLFNDAR